MIFFYYDFKSKRQNLKQNGGARHITNLRQQREPHRQASRMVHSAARGRAETRARAAAAAAAAAAARYTQKKQQNIRHNNKAEAAADTHTLTHTHTHTYMIITIALRVGLVNSRWKLGSFCLQRSLVFFTIECGGGGDLHTVCV